MGRRFQSPVRQTRRLTDWGFGVDWVNISITGTSKVLATTNLGVGTAFTLVRMRGHLHVVCVGTSGAVGDGFAGAAGIGLVSNDAFAAGAASIPGPQTDANWDGWIWHQFFDVRQATGTIADGANAASINMHMDIDSKAMRKWDPGMTLVGMVEVLESGSQNLEVNGDSRLLLKT